MEDTESDVIDAESIVVPNPRVLEDVWDVGYEMKRDKVWLSGAMTWPQAWHYQFVTYPNVQIRSATLVGLWETTGGWEDGKETHTAKDGYGNGLWVMGMGMGLGMRKRTKHQLDKSRSERTELAGFETMSREKRRRRRTQEVDSRESVGKDEDGRDEFVCGLRNGWPPRRRGLKFEGGRVEYLGDGRLN
jgi:hypothetical protein